jgi:hypothetical protein
LTWAVRHFTLKDMKSELKKRNLKALADAYLQRELRVNPEYQRGTVWNLPQKQSLIDSLLRGYQIPLFYVHLKQTPNYTGGVNTTALLVDGQQRLAAIATYLRNEFCLADPKKEKPGSVIPSVSESQPPWHGRKFEELEQEDRKRLIDRDLLVVEMTEDAKNEVRELFIRLQAGTPLTAQEKRDAWPGDFTRFVIRHAGKPSHPDSQPKDFFKLVKRGRTLSVDDGDHYVDGLADTRKFFAGLAMTIMVRARTGEDFVDLKGKTINEFYMENLDLPDDDQATIRVRRTLDLVAELPGFESLLAKKPISFQMAFHFALLVDSLNFGEYVPVWRDHIVPAFVLFQADVAAARLHYRQTGYSLPHHQRFVVLLGGSGSDTAELIRRRHDFFISSMHPAMKLKPKDPKRLFGPVEKELIWNRDGHKCQNPKCGRQVNYAEARIHHIIEHVAGGPTVLENGVLVCPQCHDSRAEMQSLAPVFQDQLRQVLARAAAAAAQTSPYA